MNAAAGSAAEQFEREFLKAGFLPGAPPHLPSATARIDRAVCRRRVCPTCNRRGMAFIPFHRGDRYRGLAICLRCGGAEEV
jgi:hypothetical protein